MQLLAEVMRTDSGRSHPRKFRQQMADNIKWIEEAGQNQMVVGSQARILYADS